MRTHRLSLLTEEGPPAGPSVRVAIATRDGKFIQGHFGSTQRFSIYDVDGQEVRFVETIAFDDVSDESGDHTELGDDRNGAKIAALAGVGIVVVQAIGGPVAARVIRAGIHPIKFSESEPIASVLGKVQAMLAGTPPPWLRKVVRAPEGRNMDFLDQD